MRHRHGLKWMKNDERRAKAIPKEEMHPKKNEKAGAHLGDGESVVRADKRSFFGRLAKILFGFCHADDGPDPDGPPDVPVFVPILTTLAVTLRPHKNRANDAP